MIEFISNPAFAQAFYKSSTASVIPSTSASFSDTLKSAASSKKKSMDEIFTQASNAYQVPENLLRSIAFHESRYQPEVVSRCGAMGVMQLMPATAKTMGVADPFDAEQNIMGGAKLLGQLLKKYDGDVKLTLAAYGAGSGSVAKYNGVPPFEETQNFVRDIMSVVDKNVAVPTSSAENSNSTYLKTADSIRNFKSYTPADYQIFLAMLLDTAETNSKESVNFDSSFPVLF